ncbi:MAG: ATP phosphoribosyltransferase regulatory subunit [Gemmatimonadetes bacterium]|nr:ATP phosphoribosyltransferase regulatory subunit [Gemmatimonadota bacterium]
MSSGTLPGFRDFFPDEFALRAHIFAAWRAVARRYAFVEYDGPPLEPLDLYTRKSGEEIVGQLYNFVDKGGREVALRPEMTPTFARMVGARANALRKPIRWFSVPQLFRYERAQRGRLREHFQLNVDIVGEPTELADAELLCVAIDIMRELGLGADDVRARFSDRRLLNALLAAIGVEEEAFGAVYGVLDKIGRQPVGVSREKLVAAGLSDAMSERVLALPAIGSLEALRAEFGASPEVAAALDRLDRYVAHVEALGGKGWVDLDLSIVRGLAYYTGIVFELFDAKGELRAVCGGGRYDNLLAALGGVDLHALGFGMGDVVLGELLKARGLVPAVGGSRADCFIAGGDGALEHPIADALALAHRLRDAGLSVDYALNAERYTTQSTRNQVDAAKKSGARAAVYFAPGDVVVVQGLSGKMTEAPKAEFPAPPLLAGDAQALATFTQWFDSTIPPRTTD